MYVVPRAVLPRLLIVFALVLVSVASLPWTPTARAAVTNIPAGDVDALIEAISTANSVDGPDEIVLAAGATYTLVASDHSSDNSRTGLPMIVTEITITGNGATITRDASAPTFRLLSVGTTGTLFLNNITISGGHSQYSGGAIHNKGALHLTDTTLTGNYAPHGGGAVARHLGEISLTRTTISNNHTDGHGGGISSNHNALTIVNSTFTGNTAGDDGGAIRMHFGSLLSLNNTFSGNSAVGQGGGIAYRNSNLGANGPIVLENTIVAGNTAPVGSDIDADAVLSGTSNLIGDGADMVGLTHGTNGNQVGTTANPINPMLDALADNGGVTQTMALQSDSPAINAGNDGVAPETDQRGVTRPHGSASDIGAYEAEFEVDYLLGTLRADILGSMPPSYYRSQLMSYIDQALLWASRGNDQRATIYIDQFITRVTMYRGMVIPVDTANDLISQARQIKLLLGAGPPVRTSN